MHTKLATALAVTVFFCAGTARAAWTDYEVVLTVETFSQGSVPCDANPGGVGMRWGCGVGVGSTYRGSFSVDSSILSVDGLDTTAALQDFRLPFGNVYYSSGPDNLSLAGFRNTLGFASAPGLLIEGGQVVDLAGGVFGAVDYPFIDFWSGPQSGLVGRNHFGAADITNAYATGSLIVTAVPEPETYAMWLLGMGAVALVVRRGRRAAVR
jgi:hypothetical protein